MLNKKLTDTIIPQSLMGQPFIASTVIEGNKSIDRTCSNCTYRDNYKLDSDCESSPKEGYSPKQIFAFPFSHLPTKINEEEVGHYCPLFEVRVDKARDSYSIHLGDWN